MASNNEVEVKISASTSELSAGLSQAESRVKEAADNINAIAEGIKGAFASVKASLANLDVKINVDLTELQSDLTQVKNNIKMRIDQISNDIAIKLALDQSALAGDLSSAETLIRNRLSTLPIQNVRVQLDTGSIQSSLNQINSQNHKVKIGLDISNLHTEITQAKTLIDSIFGSGQQNKRIEIGVNLLHLRSQLNQAKALVTQAISQMQSSNINLGVVVDVDATSTALRASLNSLKVSIDQLRAGLNSSSGGSGSGGAGGGSGGGGIGTSFAGNFLAGMAQELVSSLGMISRALIENAREIENMSRLANASTVEFQEWAFAAKTAGVSQEKLGDMMKDVNDKFGDFMQTGAGPMADFFENIAPKVGVTAKEFQNLSGPQILQKYYETLQKANVSQAEMTFYMEAIANDGTLLAPILDNNAEKLNKMSEEAHQLGIILDQEALQKTREFGAALSTVQSIISATAQRLLAQMAPALTELSNDFKDFAIDNREAINDSMQAIVMLFQELFGAVGDIFSEIGGLWRDLTATTDSEVIQQIGIIDVFKGVFQGLTLIVASVRAAIQIAFAVIRQIVIEVLSLIIDKVITTEKNFALFKTNVEFYLQSLGASLKTFATIAENALALNFSGVQAAWDQGFNNLEALAVQRSNRIARINQDAVAKQQVNIGMRNDAQSNTVQTVVGSYLGMNSLLGRFGTATSAPNQSVEPMVPAYSPNFRSSIGSGVKPSGGSATTGSADSAKAKADAAKAKAEREEQDQQKKAADLRYKYASDEEKIEHDLAKAIKEINDSVKSSDDEKRAYILKAESDVAEKRKQLKIKELVELQKLELESLANNEKAEQRLLEYEIARLQDEFNAGKVSNVEKVKLEDALQQQLYESKRNGLLKRFDLDAQMSALTGEGSKSNEINNQILDLDNQKMIADGKKGGFLSEAEMADFEAKFGDMTERLSNLWDDGLSAMMNGTFTWSSALNAIFTELSSLFIQKMVSEPLKEYMAGLMRRLALRLGFMKTETAVEAAGQAAQTSATVVGETARTTATGTGIFARLGMRSFEAIKSIMISAWQAMANALASVPPPWNIALGGLAFAGVAALAGKVASARGGYDIPAGVNPLTQLHEKEMVLPAQHANTIRALGQNMNNGGGFGQSSGESQSVTNLNIQAWDSKDVRRFMEKHGRELAGSLKGYNRNFGK